MINKVKSRAGFTLLEALIAIFILVSAVVATLGVASSGLSDSISAKEQIIAYYLAQDAIEYVKNARERSALAALNSGSDRAVAWSNFKDNFSECTAASDVTALDGSAVDECGIDTTKPFSDSSAIIAACDTNCRLQFSSATGLYSHSTSGGTSVSPSEYTRHFFIQHSGTLGDEFRITVVVRWHKGTVKELVVREYILNWQ